MPNQRLIEGLRGEYLQALKGGDARGANAVIDSALARGVSPNKIYLGIIMPGQADLGEAWHSGSLSVAAEHLATQITLNVMARLRQAVRPKVSLGLRAVVAVVNGDSHFIGGQVVADFLTMEGWEVDYLGTSTPPQELIQFVRERKPQLVGISIILAEYRQALSEMIGLIRKIPDCPKVIIGGAGLPRGEEEILKLGADAYALNAYQAVAEVKKLFGLAGSGVLLFQYLKGLGERIVALRVQRQLSQQELAALAGLDRAYISSVENGKQNLTIGAILKLADALDVSLEDLLIGRGS